MTNLSLLSEFNNSPQFQIKDLPIAEVLSYARAHEVILLDLIVLYIHTEVIEDIQYHKYK